MPTTVNGEPVELDAPTPLPDLLARLGLDKGVYAVEINKALVRAAERPEHVVQPGDAVEIVTLVGGG